jgi:membrane fusion protein, adhesin transport system
MEKSSSLLERVSGKINPSRASNILLGGILVFIIVFFIWAALTELDRTVYSRGVVVPTAQLQRVSNLEGGIVESILVREGEIVDRGEPLMTLDKTLSSANLDSSEITFEALQYKVDRLEAEVAGRTPRFVPPANPQLADQVAVEQALYLSRQSDQAAELAGARDRITQAQRSVSEAQANLAASVSNRDAAREQLDLMRPLIDAGVEPRSTLIQAQRNYDVARSQASSASAAISRAQASVSEANSALDQIRQRRRSEAANELATARAELAAQRSTLPAAQDRLTRTVIRSPLAGRVNRVLVNTVGGSIQPSQPLVEIVPSDGNLVVQTRVSPSDIAFVFPGQDALIKITAYDYGVYGGLEGKVENISPDAIVDERTGESFYTVTVRANERGLRAQNGTMMPITPGMVADVNLTGDKRSVLDYILTPFSRVRNDAFREQ